MREIFISIIAEVSQKLGITCRTFSDNWIIELRDPDNRILHIFGYLFPCNSASAAEIAKEKPATSLVFKHVNIPCIHHVCFLNSAHTLASPYVKPEGTFQQLLDFFHKNGNDVVLKPLKGTGGLDVFRCRSSKELEIAAMRIFAREYGLAACPFISLGHEYRAIVLAGEVKLVYRKRRATVVADGKTSVENLILEKMKTTKASWSAVAEAINAFSQAELKSIPKTGEIPIQWKHNLGLGLSEVDLELEDSLCTEIGKLAVAAATAIGITFCSVDVAETQEALIVVEVNAGVMMDVFANDSTRRHIARQVYEDAIQLCFDRLPK